MYRILELAVNHKKYRVRKKNIHRFARIFRKFNFVNPFDRMRETVVLHEYEEPEEVYIKQCQEIQYE